MTDDDDGDREMSMVDGIHAMGDGDFAMFEELWDGIQEAKDDRFARPDQPFEFGDESEKERVYREFVHEGTSEDEVREAFGDDRLGE